eukprot:EG_transcript_16132
MAGEPPAVCGAFDWLVEYADLHDVLSCSEGLVDAPVLVVGCGNSTLSHAMHAAGHPRVVSVDIDAGIIEAMRARHASTPGLEWLCLDIGEVHRVLPAASVGLAVDKGTLDAMLCGELVHVAKYLCAVWAVLCRGAPLHIVSLYPEAFLTALLSLPGDPFDVVHTYLPNKIAWCDAIGGQTSVSIATLRKAAGPPPDVDVVARHLQVEMDNFTRRQNPLLTPQARARIEQRFAAQAAARGTVADGPLPLGDAYLALFEEALREGYPYDAFLADWAAYQLEGDAGSGAGGSDTAVTLAEALRFVEAMQ